MHANGTHTLKCMIQKVTYNDALPKHHGMYVTRYAQGRPNNSNSEDEMYVPKVKGSFSISKLGG